MAPFAAAVADGVGGGPAGEIAAAALIHRVASSARRVGSVERVRELLRWSNGDIEALVRADPSVAGMATTFTGVFLSDSGLVLAHVGDSRGYLLRAGTLSRKTRDDSWVQHLVDSGLISQRDALTHPRRNIVTASFHGDPRDGDALTVTRFEPCVGDRWLLCSDGISDYLPDDLLGQTLREQVSPDAAARELVRLALEAGTHDNVTAVVCDVVRDVRSGITAVDARVRFAGAAAEHAAEDAAIA